MPHRTLEASIKALQVPALLVADMAPAEILAVNERAREDVSHNLLVGSNLVAVLKELFLESNAFMRVCAGRDQAVGRQKFNGGPEAWEVVSRLPEISGYPPSVFMTFHHASLEQERALAAHRRDRLAVECAILIDRTRSDLATLTDMAKTNYLQVEQMAKVWTERLAEIEELSLR